MPAVSYSIHKNSGGKRCHIVGHIVENKKAFSAIISEHNTWAAAERRLAKLNRALEKQTK